MRRAGHPTGRGRGVMGPLGQRAMAPGAAGGGGRHQQAGARVRVGAVAGAGLGVVRRE